MQQVKGKQKPTDGKTNIVVLTNDQQLFIMDQVKSKHFSIDKALKFASQLSQESQDSSLEFRKEPTSPTVVKPDEVYNFAIILYPNAYSQPGCMCCLQIDFMYSSIRIIEKRKTRVIVPFENVKEFANKENSNQLKIICTHGVLKFTANSEDKHFLFELLGMVILDNECAKYDNNKKKDLDRQSMNLVFRNRNILKEGILEKRVDANIILWLERYIVIKEGEFSYSEIKNSENSYLVQVWTTSMNVKPISDSEFCVTHNKRQYIFRVKNKSSMNVKAERDSWIKAFWQASARKNIKTKWMENVRLSSNILLEEETYGNAILRKEAPSPPLDYTDHLNCFKSSSDNENDTLNFTQEPNETRNKPYLLKSGVQQRKTRPVPLPLPPPPPLPQTLERSFRNEMKYYSMKELKYFSISNISINLLNTSVWPHIPDLTENLKHRLLEEKFAVKHKEKTKYPVANNDGKVFLNEKKAQNVMIMMKGTFLSTVNAIPSALVSLEELDYISLEDIRILQRYQPDPDEIEMYQKLSTEGTELKAVDKCMLKLSQIPFLRERLELIHTIWSFNEDNNEFIMSISLASKICEEILTSERLVKVLAYVLAIFNYLNTSQKKMSRALSGFDLNYLCHLDSMRGVDNYSILKALKCHLVDDKDSSLQNFPDDLKTLRQCDSFSVKSLNISLEVWKQTMANVKASVTSIEKQMKNISSSDAKFFRDVKAFRLTKMNEYDEISNTSSQILKKFHKILKKFALGTQTSSEKLFENLQKFIKDYINVT